MPPVPGEPVRVIYAKLTTTGAYDVVARTSNIALADARTLAERLLPGNPPLDAALGEEAAHVRPPEGGHIVWRFARYGWSDGERGEVFITDIAWYAAADFERARCNAFALLPRTDRIFDEAAELAPFTVPPTDAGGERARLAELHGQLAGEARQVIAGAAAADPVLLVHPGDRAGAVELVLLLLPPRLRALLTFQTQAFRVPPALPRLTLVDRGYANLREAPWQVLPSLDVDVPLELAGRFIGLGGDPAALEQAQAWFEEAALEPASLRAGVASLIALAEVAALLQARNGAGVLRAAAGLDARARPAVIRQVRERLGESAVAAGLIELERELGDGPERVLALLEPLGELPAAMVGALVDHLGASAPAALLAELAVRCARAGDVPRLVQLLALDRRAAGARLAGEGAGFRPEVQQLVLAVDGGRAAELLLAAAAVEPQVRGKPAAELLHRLCRDAVGDALERVQPTAAGLDAMLRLADAADAYVAAAGSSPGLPPLLARYELARPDAAERAAAGLRLPARAALAGATLVRACGAAGPDAERYAGLAVTLLEAVERREVEQVRQALQERGVGAEELVALPGSDALLPLLGGNALQAGIARRLVAAIQGIAAGHDAAVQELAAAVVVAHGQRVRIAAGGELARSVLAALRGLPGPASAGREIAPAAELCVELLAVITDAEQLAELEDAALGDRMAVRLQRLDRSVAHCRAVEREDRYERYAAAIESADVPLNPAVRERLREALGTRGLQRRLLQAVSSVIARDPS